MKDYVERAASLTNDGRLTLQEWDARHNRRDQVFQVTEEEASILVASFLRTGFENIRQE